MKGIRMTMFKIRDSLFKRKLRARNQSLNQIEIVRQGHPKLRILCKISSL